MAINRSNYEAYLIDFMEDQLSMESRSEVLLFLENNPDIAEEFSDIQEFTLPKVTIEMSHKDTLKHSEFKKINGIQLHNYESYFINSIEDNLNREEKRELVLFLQLHPELSFEFEQFKKTLLQPSSKIEFPDKDSLRDIAIAPTRRINKANYLNVLFDFHEKNLDVHFEDEVALFIDQNPMVKSHFIALQKLYLTPDPTIVFASKEQLKVKATPIIHTASLMYWQKIAVAAMVILLFTFSWMNWKGNESTTEQFAFKTRKEHSHKIQKFQQKQESTVIQEGIPSQTKSMATYQAKPKIVEPQVEMAQVREEEIEFQILASKSATELAYKEEAVHIYKVYYAPMANPISVPSNIVEYASLYLKSQKPYLEGFEEKALVAVRKPFLNNEIIDFKEIAMVGIKGLNQLTESNFELPDNKPSIFDKIQK